MNRPRSTAHLGLVILVGSAFVLALALPAVATGASQRPHATAPLSDDFTSDTSLNPNLWLVNGAVGSLFGESACPSCTLVPLAPTFSTAGMEVAQVNASSEVGTIQSVASFAPPFTVSASVEGTVSNGHPFVFGISSADGTYGVQVTGNLNPDDCSYETDCGNPATCGTPASSSIPSNQCYYGIYARSGTGGTSWAKSPMLDLTPSVGVVYTLEAAVDASGNAEYTVSQSGEVLGSSTVHIGTGPFYVILAQSEGAPVPGPGPNQAVWKSVSMSFTATVPVSSSPSPPFDWLIVIALAILLVIVLVVIVAYARRRNLVVTVVDSGDSSALPGAGVWAAGPENLSGHAGSDGRITFRGVRSGDYAVRAGATGFESSTPVTVPVTKKTEYTVRLARSTAAPPTPSQPDPSPAGPRHTAPSPSPASGPAAAPPPAGTSAAPVPRPTPAVPPEPDGEEGWAGERLRKIAQTFRAKGALSPETALTADELGLSRMFVRIMKRRTGRTRVFVEVNGRYYLNERALQEMKEP